MSAQVRPEDLESPQDRPTLIGRMAARTSAWIAAWWVSVCERSRMRLSAALMDAGAHLALDPIERRARRLRRRLIGRKGRRLGPYGVLLAMGADELAGQATLVLGRRATSSGQGPGRIHSLLCVAVSEGGETPEAARTFPGVFDSEALPGYPRSPLEDPKFYWAVRTQWADAPLGLAGAGTSMLRECEGALETALIAFFTDPVSPALAGLGRSSPHEPPGEGLGGVPEIEEVPAKSLAKASAA